MTEYVVLKPVRLDGETRVQGDVVHLHPQDAAHLVAIGWLVEKEKYQQADDHPTTKEEKRTYKRKKDE